MSDNAVTRDDIQLLNRYHKHIVPGLSADMIKVTFSDGSPPALDGLVLTAPVPLQALKQDEDKIPKLIFYSCAVSLKCNMKNFNDLVYKKVRDEKLLIIPKMITTVNQHFNQSII